MLSLLLPKLLFKNFCFGAPKLEKERKKEKKEKKKEKKEKRKERKEHQESQRSLSEKKVKEFLLEKREAETEQLEKSNVTEELDRPSCLSVPSTSCDSTQNNNNNKRKRDSPPGCGNTGSVFLLRLPSKKQNEFDAALAKEQQSCSTSGRSCLPVQSGDAKSGPAKGTSGLSFGNNWGEVKSLTSRKIEGKTEIKPVPEAVVLQFHCIACLSSEDLDWLFQGRKQEAHAEKKQRFGSESLSCSRSFSGLLWPRAEFLREVDLFALPYTVPY